MNLGINVLSLFDGISCGMIALERTGIQVDNYYASEIDKYAIQISQKNYPNIIRLGDINNWKIWQLPKIDLIMGGSPCQGFSNAGMGLNFEDPRSKLFFVFVDILKFYQPQYFLLENVKMKQEWQDIISDLVGVKPIEINSSLVSAQNRKRLYWTNIPNIEQPENKQIYLKNIIDKENGQQEFKLLNRLGKEKSNKKAGCLTAGAHSGGNHSDMDILCFGDPEKIEYTEVGRVVLGINGAAIRNQVTKRGIEEQLNIRKDEKSNCVVPSYPNKLNGMCVRVGEADIRGFDITKRVYSPAGKSPALTTMQGGHREPKISEDNNFWRRLSPVECERLQTLPDNYTAGVSNSQRYKGIGNGWTVDVIAHILSNMKY